MSSINLGDPQVLANFIKSQILEGKGEYSVQEQVLVFKGADGSQYIVPNELAEEVKKKIAARSKTKEEKEAEKKAKEEEKKAKEEEKK